MQINRFEVLECGDSEISNDNEIVKDVCAKI